MAIFRRVVLPLLIVLFATAALPGAAATNPSTINDARRCNAAFEAENALNAIFYCRYAAEDLIVDASNTDNEVEKAVNTSMSGYFFGKVAAAYRARGDEVRGRRFLERALSIADTSKFQARATQLRAEKQIMQQWDAAKNPW